MDHPVVSHDEWIEARRRLLAEEKEFTQLREKLAQKRRSLPWEQLTQNYTFDSPDGKCSIEDLFGDHSQLIVYHFMFGPTWDAGCPHCSFWADHFDGASAHLAARDVAFAAVSRAPIDKITAYQRRMGWRFRWVSSHDSPFNFDFGVSFTPESLADGTALYNYRAGDAGGEEREGLSVFIRENAGVSVLARNDSRVFHTYSAYARGIDMINGTYQFLDLVPLGRNEESDHPQSWVRRHDEYDI